MVNENRRPNRADLEGFSGGVEVDFIVMAGLVPAIYAFARGTAIKTWMPATSAGMTLGLTESLISGRRLRGGLRGLGP
jgi:hypothetical protein